MSTVRFSHYCLEDGDEYFGDVIAEFRSFRIVTSINNDSLFSSTSSSNYSSLGSPQQVLNNNNNNNSNFVGSPQATNNNNSNFSSSNNNNNNFLSMIHRRFTELPSSNNNSNNKQRIEFIPDCIRGKLRFGSKGIYFESDDSAIPVFGFKSQTILNAYDSIRNGNSNNDGIGSSSSIWSTPVVSLSTASSAFIPQDAAAALSRSANSEFLQQTVILPFWGSVTGQRRFGLPHPHLIDSSSFSQPNTFLCFILPFASTPAIFNDYLNRMNMLLLARHTSVEDAKRDLKLLMIQKAKESTSGFKYSLLEDPETEDILRETCCHRIQPLIRERGRAVISSLNIYFQSTFPITTTASSNEKNSLLKIPLRTVTQVERRWFDTAETALEVFFEKETNNSNNNNNKNDTSSSSSHQISSIFLHFENVEDREMFSSSLRKHPIVKPILRAASVPFVQELWHQGKISNFDYLMFLNSFAGRSKQDLSQYPVLPWIISNYTSRVFDFDDPSNYRDLSKPIGALEPRRLEMFKQRARDLKEMGQQPFLYATHYSNSAYVIYFLLRSAPQLMLVLQSGRWDKPQRLFDSVPEVWKSVMENPTDVKELIPEFFDTSNSEDQGNFLDLRQSLLRKSGNSSSTLGLSDAELESLFDFGKKDDGESVRFSVQLPEWANGDVATFIKINKMALESDIVSASIHNWIDLIFGYKQKGDDAWKANNVFHPSCYEDMDSHNNNVDATTNNNNKNNKKQQHHHDAEDEEMRLQQLRAYRQMFGQVPRQIFTQAHPLRRCICEKFATMDDEENKQRTTTTTTIQPLASLREALLQLSQQDLNEILKSPPATSVNNNNNSVAGSLVHRNLSQSSFGSKPSSSASPSFATNNNNYHHQNQNEDPSSTSSPRGHLEMQEASARAVELAEQLEKQLSNNNNNNNNNSINSEKKNSSFTNNNNNNHHQEDEKSPIDEVPPKVEDGEDLFANFATPPPKELLGLAKNNNDQATEKNKNEGDDDDDEKNQNNDNFPSTSSNNKTNVIIQCLPRIFSGTTLPDDVQEKFIKSGRFGSVYVTSATTTNHSSSATSNTTSPTTSNNNPSTTKKNQTCYLIFLSKDGSEIGVLPTTSRGFDSLSTCILPEKCFSVVCGASSSSNWIILISQTGNILVFSPETCKVYARIPDSGDVSDVISCVSFWRGGNLLFCGRENGSMVSWSISENKQQQDHLQNKSSSSSAADSSSSSPSSFVPPMVSKTAMQSAFGTGRPSVAACRDSNNNNNGLLFFASDDGETLMGKPKSSTGFNVNQLIREFAGFPHDIDMKSVISIWPINCDRIINHGGSSSSSSSLKKSLLSAFSQEELLSNEDSSCVSVLGLLTDEGKIYILGAQDDRDESDMLEIISVLDINNNSDESSIITDQCMLTRSIIQNNRTDSSSNCDQFLVSLTNEGKKLAIFDSDFCFDEKPVVENLFSSSSSSNAKYTNVCAFWPFVVAVDSSSGQVCVWELLVF